MIRFIQPQMLPIIAYMERSSRLSMKPFVTACQRLNPSSGLSRTVVTIEKHHYWANQAQFHYSENDIRKWINQFPNLQEYDLRGTAGVNGTCT